MSRLSRESFSKLVYEAVEAGDAAALGDLLDRGLFIDGLRYAGGETLLHLNARQGNGRVTRLLLEAGCDVDALDKDRRTPLHVAFLRDRHDVAEELLKYYPDVNVKDNWNDTAVHCYAAHVKINEDDDDDEEEAETSRTIELARKMLVLEGNPNEPDDRKHTPFHSVLMNGNCRLVSLFMRYGADVRARNCYGGTCLHYCALNGNGAVTKLVLDTRLLSTEDKTLDKGETALHWAAQYAKYDCLRCLLDAGARVDCTDYDGRTPLFYVAQPHYPLYSAEFTEQRRASLELLVRRWADLNHCTRLGDTILRILVKQDDSSGESLAKLVVAYLLYGQHVRKVRVNDKNMKIIRNDSMLKAHYQACSSELAAMKRRRVPECTVTFFQVVDAPLATVATFTRNPDFARFFDGPRLRQSFPIYADLVLERFHEAAGYQKMLEAATCTLYDIFQFADPTSVFYEKVLRSMDKSDIANLKDYSSTRSV
ncbi:hypothetical protein TKK_0002424 [Trichogramma kaykai]|uniref:Uncharacterized protein n=1 Tax=Trichogramma kaykai TaxID=54128 RepID=A0ABD2VX68_9HYME